MAIFKDRKLTSWTPKNQVIKEIGEKSLKVSPEMKCLFECGGLKNELEIDSFFSTGGVDFKTSNVKNHDAREYVITFEDNPITKVIVVIFPENIEVKNINLENKDCSCP